MFNAIEHSDGAQLRLQALLDRSWAGCMAGWRTGRTRCTGHLPEVLESEF